MQNETAGSLVQRAGKKMCIFSLLCLLLSLSCAFSCCSSSCFLGHVGTSRESADPCRHCRLPSGLHLWTQECAQSLPAPAPKRSAGGEWAREGGSGHRLEVEEPPRDKVGALAPHPWCTLHRAFGLHSLNIKPKTND